MLTTDPLSYGDGNEQISKESKFSYLGTIENIVYEIRQLLNNGKTNNADKIRQLLNNGESEELLYILNKEHQNFQIPKKKEIKFNNRMDKLEKK